MNLNYFDICVAIIVVLMGIRGIWRGFVKGFLGFVGLLVGIFLASRLCEKSGELFAANIYRFEAEGMNTLVGFAAVLLVAWVLSLILSDLLSRIVKVSPLGFVDSALGIIFEGGKAFLIIALLVVLGIGQVEFLGGFYKSIQKNSIIFPLMDSLTHAVTKIDFKGVGAPLENVDLKGAGAEIGKNVGEGIKKGVESGAAGLDKALEKAGVKK